MTARARGKKFEDLCEEIIHQAIVEFVLTDRQGNQESRKLRRFGKNFGQNGRDEYTYSYFYSPELINGTQRVDFDYHDDKKDDDTWIFIPEISEDKRLTRRINSSWGVRH